MIANSAATKTPLSRMSDDDDQEGDHRGASSPAAARPTTTDVTAPASTASISMCWPSMSTSSPGSGMAEGPAGRARRPSRPAAPGAADERIRLLETLSPGKPDAVRPAAVRSGAGALNSSATPPSSSPIHPRGDQPRPRPAASATTACWLRCPRRYASSSSAGTFRHRHHPQQRCDRRLLAGAMPVTTSLVWTMPRVVERARSRAAGCKGSWRRARGPRTGRRHVDRASCSRGTINWRAVAAQRRARCRRTRSSGSSSPPSRLSAISSSISSGEWTCRWPVFGTPSTSGPAPRCR